MGMSFRSSAGSGKEWNTILLVKCLWKAWTVSSCQMRSVSQNQIRQGEHDIQFSGLFSQTFVPGFSVPEQSFDYSKNVFNL